MTARVDGLVMKIQIDHLVVVAQTLELEVQWCEATIGITPGPGGEHAQYGTHNRLFKIATPANPLAYLEIIAINPEAKRPTSATATPQQPAAFGRDAARPCRHASDGGQAVSRF